MNVSVTDLTDTRKELVITVSGEEINEEAKRVLQQFRKEARIPGFRPGKAPESLIRSRYRKALTEELNRAMNARVYQEVTEKSDLKVYSVVSFDEPEGYFEGEEIAVDMTVDITPDFELPEYKEVPVEVDALDVGDEEIEEAIANLRMQRANFEVVERPAAKGDYVQVSYEGKVDDQPVKELIGDDQRLAFWASVSKGWEEAGSEQGHQFGVPPVIDGLVGMAAGDEKDVEHTFADDFPVEALRGKTAVYHVTVSEVRERVLPEMDEEFLRAQDVESVEELKDKILTDLENRKRHEIEQQKRDQLIKHLLNSVEFALPESGIEGETQNVMGRIMVENMQRGVPHEEFEKNKEALHAQARSIAVRDVKLQIMLHRIAEKEKIEVSQDDLQRAVYTAAMQSRQSPDDFVKELRKDRGRVMQMQRQILFGKTLDLLAKEAKVTEKTS